MDIFFNPSEQRMRAGWRIVLQLLLMTLLSGGFFGGFSQIANFDSTILFALPNFLGVLLSIWLAARLLDKRAFADYGIRMDALWLKEFLAGAFFAAIAMGVIFLIEWHQDWLTFTGWGWEETSENFSGSIILFLIAMLMVGFHEELFSRGYQLLNITEGLNYPRLGAQGAATVAVLFTSGLFGILHVFNPNVGWLAIFNIVLAGVILAIPYLITGSLALSVGLHFSWNFMQAGIFGFPVSGLDFNSSIIEIHQQGPDLFTGGDFGPEAGMVGWIGMAIMLGLSIVYMKKAGYAWSLADRFHKPSIQSL